MVLSYCTVKFTGTETEKLKNFKPMKFLKIAGRSNQRNKDKQKKDPWIFDLAVSLICQIFS